MHPQKQTTRPTLNINSTISGKKTVNSPPAIIIASQPRQQIVPAKNVLMTSSP
jgi:hypothetical protein